jgi:hypothetical protein
MRWRRRPGTMALTRSWPFNFPPTNTGRGNCRRRRRTANGPSKAQPPNGLPGIGRLLRRRLPASLLLPVGSLAPLRGWAANGRHHSGRLLLQERLLESSHQIICRVVSPKLVSLLGQPLEVGEVSPGEEDPKLPGQPVQEEAGKENALLCPTRANFQHGSWDSFVPPRAGMSNKASARWKSLN